MMRVRRANYQDNRMETVPRHNESHYRRADFCLSIHANAAGNRHNVFFGGPPNIGGHGIETLYQPSTSATHSISRDYADIVQRHVYNFGKKYGQIERSLRIYPSSATSLLTSTLMPTVLTEHGFFTNFREAILLMDDAYRRGSALALANAIDEIYAVWKGKM